MPDYTVLRAEVLVDPLSRGYKSLTDDAVATDLNTLYRTYQQPTLSLTKLAIWAAKTGVRARIEAHATNGSSPVQAICLSLRDLLTGLSGPALDLGNSDNQSMLVGLVAAGVLTEEDRDALLALTVISISRAIELVGWGVPVQAPDINYVRSA